MSRSQAYYCETLNVIPIYSSLLQLQQFNLFAFCHIFEKEKQDNVAEMLKL